MKNFLYFVLCIKKVSINGYLEVELADLFLPKVDKFGPLHLDLVCDIVVYQAATEDCPVCQGSHHIGCQGEEQAEGNLGVAGQ